MTLMAKSLGDRIVDAARSQLGVGEDPRGSNDGPGLKPYFKVAGIQPPAEWCALFCNWCFHEASGREAPWGRAVVYVPAIVAWAKQNGIWSREHDPRDTGQPYHEPMPGDLFILGDFKRLDTLEQYKHIGVVASVTPGSLGTIEGNHSDEVEPVTRSRSFDGVSDYVAGYVLLTPRDASAAVPSSSPGRVDGVSLQDMASQRLILNLHALTSNGPLICEIQSHLAGQGFLGPQDVDGIFGPRTRGALEAFCQHVHLNNMATGRFGPSFAQALLGAPAVVPPPAPAGGNTTPASPDDFSTALSFTLQWEGGFVHDPLDLGGATNRGITQHVYDDFRIRQGQPTRPVESLEDSEMRSIYHGYWAAVHADLMVRPLAVAMFDTAVNFGAHGAVEFLQEALKIPVDGSFGPQTEAGLKARNDRSLALEVVDGRIAYRHKRVEERPSQARFLQGWLNRDHALRDFIQTV